MIFCSRFWGGGLYTRLEGIYTRGYTRDCTVTLLNVTVHGERAHPTVVIVTTHHQKVAGIEVKGVSLASFSMK